MIVLDTTVLVYATGAGHRFRDPCRDLLAAVAEARLEATTTAEVIQEFTHVRARRRDREDAATLAAAYLDLLGPLLPIDEDDVRDGLALFREHDTTGAFDAVLAATARRAGARALVSADAGFTGVPGITHVTPDARGVARLLRPA